MRSVVDRNVVMRRVTVYQFRALSISTPRTYESPYTEIFRADFVTDRESIRIMAMCVQRPFPIILPQSLSTGLSGQRSDVGSRSMTSSARIEHTHTHTHTRLTLSDKYWRRLTVPHLTYKLHRSSTKFHSSSLRRRPHSRLSAAVFPEGRSFGETMSSASGLLATTTGQYGLSSDDLVIIYLILWL